MSIKRWFCVSVLLGAGILPGAYGADLSDLAFLPAAKQLVGATSFGYGTDSGDLDDASGSRVSARASHEQTFIQSFDYGIGSRLSVSATWWHTWTTTHYDFPGSARTEDHRSNTQLMLGLTGRMLDQEHHGFDLDLIATVPGTLSLAMTRELQNVTIRASGGFYHGGGGRGFDLVRDMDIDVGRFWGYDAALQGQLRLSSAISLDLAVQYVSSNVDNARGTADGDTFTVNFPDQVNFGATLNYQMIRDRLVMRLGGAYQILGQRRDLYADPALDLLTAPRKRRSVGLGFLYNVHGR